MLVQPSQHTLRPERNAATVRLTSVSSGTFMNLRPVRLAAT